MITPGVRSGPAYPAARAIAPKIRAHFVHHIAKARALGRSDIAAEPAETAIETVIDAAFWASLRREEGITTRVSLALLEPHDAPQPMRFARALPLLPAALSRLAPAVERPGIHLGVCPHEGQLMVWGATRVIPAFCPVIEVVASGLVVVKYRHEAFGKFVNVAVLEGDQVKIVDEGVMYQPDCPRPVRSMLGFDPRPDREGPVDILVQLAASMRAHGRGGALLVVDDASRAWRESIIEPVLYQVDPAFTALAELVAREAAEAESHEWQEDLRRAVDAVAGLTAVDGVTVLSSRYELVAFGAKITRRRGNPPVERVMVTEPIEGAAAFIATPTQLGGTRHLSAAQFVSDQHDAIALVASQDGRFTIFKWSAVDGLVHAHRVEALLL
jgi:hypothetical protein